MAITFQKTLDPDDQAIGFIEKAIRRTPANTAKLSAVLSNIRNNKGDLFLIMDNYNQVGIVYVTIYPTENGKVICPLLVGGDNIKGWQQELHQFMLNLKARTRSVAIQFIARKGWQRLYPMYRDIGTIYEYRGGSSDR